jgi:DNA-binding GntR family transcriptional regulator
MQAANGLADKAYRKMRQAILRGDLAPGEALFESHLADKLGMSRTPVREALRVLARDGFIETIPARGYVVPRRSVEDLRELFELRESLEGLSTRAAAVRATEAEIVQLGQLCDRYEQATSLETWTQIGTEFHNFVVVVARNRRLATILDSLNFQIVLSRRSALSSAETIRNEAVREHRAIVDAITSRDSEAAEQCARTHVRTSYAAALQSFRSGL